MMNTQHCTGVILYHYCSDFRPKQESEFYFLGISWTNALDQNAQLLQSDFQVSTFLSLLLLDDFALPGYLAGWTRLVDDLSLSHQWFFWVFDVDFD